MSERNSYIAITQTEECRSWLIQSLSDLGEVVAAEAPTIERVLQLADAILASAVFVQLNSSNYHQETSLIEGLIAAKPFLPVFVVGDTVSQDLLLAVMRVGARDFIKIGTRANEVVTEVKRLVSYDANAMSAQSSPAGRITAVVSARPGSDAPMLALHLALAVQKTAPTLLLDLGVPHGDAALYLGLTTAYSFIDAVHNLHRIDATLIQTGFDRHKSGLTVLSMPEEPWPTNQFTSADIYVLLRTLRRHFSHVIVNLGGMPRSEFLTLLLANVDKIIVLIEQALPSCRQNIQLLQHLREEKIALSHAGLVVDRYLPKMAPDAESLAKSFGLPLLGVLAPSELARMATMNSGESMFELSPNDPYTEGMRKLAGSIVNAELEVDSKSPNLLQRLISAIFPNESKAR